VANAANLTPGLVAPGELVTLFGTGMGPLDGTRVLFDGVPAPLLFVGDGQINAVVPFATVLRDSTEIVVESPSGRTNSITVPVKPAVPGIFRIVPPTARPRSTRTARLTDRITLPRAVLF
jgi:uncharacterized protein (TIGR03437 family)